MDSLFSYLFLKPKYILIIIIITKKILKTDIAIINGVLLTGGVQSVGVHAVGVHAVGVHAVGVHAVGLFESSSVINKLIILFIVVKAGS